MNRVNLVLNHDLFKNYMEQNELAEANRRFCHHNIAHVVDVARIAMLLNLEEEYGIDKEVVYATALLHDIGRHIQYRDDIPHETAGAKLAPEILRECGFSDLETDVIVEAIANHRNKEIKEDKNLNGLLYRADKMSRACYSCKVQQECKWSNEKKNLELIL